MKKKQTNKIALLLLSFVVVMRSQDLKMDCFSTPSRCGVALDAWMFPLEDEIFSQVKQPIFFINSEKFQWAGNISRMRKLDSAATKRKMITIR